MHITINIPCWALLSVKTQVEVFEDIVPVLGPHLSSVTIILEDLHIVAPNDIFQLLDLLDTDRVWNTLSVYRYYQMQPTNVEPGFYNLRTTYASIILFTNRIDYVLPPTLYNAHDKETSGVSAELFPAWLFGHLAKFA
jgi:hypothetical protein